MFRIKPIHIFIALLIILVVVWWFFYYKKSTFEGAEDSRPHVFVDDDRVTISFDKNDGSIILSTDNSDDVVIHRNGSIDNDSSGSVNNSGKHKGMAFTYTNRDAEVVIICISFNEKDSHVLVIDSNNYNILGQVAYNNGELFDMHINDSKIEGQISLSDSTDPKRISDVDSKKSSYGTKISGHDNTYSMGKNLRAYLGPDHIKTMDLENWLTRIESKKGESLIIVCDTDIHLPKYYIAFTLFMVKGEFYIDPILIHKKKPEEYGDKEEEEKEEDKKEDKGGRKKAGEEKEASVPKQIIDFWKQEMSTNDYIKKTQIVPLSCQTCPSQCSSNAATTASPATGSSNKNAPASGPLSNFANNTVNTAGGVANNAINTAGGIAGAGLLGAGVGAGLLGSSAINTAGGVANSTVNTAGGTLGKLADVAGGTLGKVADVAGGVAKSAVGGATALGLGAGKLGEKAIGTAGGVTNNAIDKTTGLLKPGQGGMQGGMQFAGQQGQLQYNQQGQLVMVQPGQQINGQMIPMPGYKFAFPPVAQYPGMQQVPVQSSDFMPVTADFSKFSK